jgi:hypothetical protein
MQKIIRDTNFKFKLIDCYHQLWLENNSIIINFKCLSTPLIELEDETLLAAETLT